MNSNFYATNQLTDVLNNNFNSSFRKICVNENGSVKENCDLIIECIHEIQAKLQTIDQELKEKVEPTLYERLKNISVSVHDNNIQVGEVVIGMLFMGLGMIIGAIQGSTERNLLEKALKECEQALDEFRPASAIYQDILTSARIKLELIIRN